MKGDETASSYLNRAQEYADALANIGEPFREKDLVMLVISGLREEYNSLKSTLLTRLPTAFADLHGILSDHDYMIKKSAPVISAPQAFTAVSSRSQAPAGAPQPDAIQAIQQLVSQLGFQLQPTTQQSQAFYTSYSQNSRGRGRSSNNRRGRGSSNRFTGGNRSQFSWASNQNTVYGTCNRCGIGHLPSQCPNRDPATLRPRHQPSANYADYHSQTSTSWLPDTGSNSHATPELSSLDHAEPYYGEEALHVGNGKALPILHIGTTRFYSPNKTFSLSHILHVPQIKKNLLSVQKFCHDNHVFFEFHDTFFSVKDKFTRTTLLTGPSENGLYSIRLPQIQPISRVAYTTVRASVHTWHQRLGHPHPQLLHSMLSKQCLPVLNNSSSSPCNACHVGKSSKLHLSPSNFRSNNILDLVICDVWGPAPVTSCDGHHYFLLCVDHFSRYMWIFPLKQKSEVYAIFKQFIVMVERQFQTKLKSVQSDWGGEFRNLSAFLSSLGIIHRRSCPHTSEQNGFVERRHRHVVETGLTLLAQSGVPSRFWHFAYDTAVYLINRMPSRTSSNISPFEHVFNHTPDYSFLRVFGSQCYPHIRPYNKHKMDFRSIPCVFLGYSPTHHGYRCLDPTSDRIYIARHVRFTEQYFPFLKPSSPPSKPPTPDPYVSSYPSPPIPTSPSTTTTPTTSSITPPSSPRASTPTGTLQPETPLPGHTQTATSSPANTQTHTPSPVHEQTHTPSTTFRTYSRRSKVNQTDQAPPIPPPRNRPANLRPNPKTRVPYNPSAYHASTTVSDGEPTSFTIANKSPQWRSAMAEEYAALIRNGTWSLVPPVSNANVVDCKWVYKIKRDQTGAIQRYKARLVAKGFNQQPGVDYHETFSPVVKSTTIRTVLSLAVTRKWALRQLDVQNAFLHGDLKETVYLRQPPGFIDPHKPDHVCLLHKSLYGLKQAPRAWFHRLSEALHSLGFKGSKTDPSLFIYSAKGTILYMLVYVDDIILTGNNPSAIDRVIHSLSQTFAIQDLGSLSYFLGIEVVCKGPDMILSQKKYILELLQRAGLSQAKPVTSPITTIANLSLGDSPLFDNPVRYRQIVGALQYVTLSRPDITFAVNKVCQFMHSPTENHWSAVKRILRYLQGTSNYGLLITQASTSILHAYTDAHSPSLNAFSDADWAGCPDDRRSTGGYAIYLGSNLISWSARKQRTVSRSSTESEYKALADTVAELTWLEALLHELEVPMKSAPVLWCDNLGATYLSANPVFHARTKHVEVDFHFVREKVAEGKLSVQFISTDDQIADIFTKPLSSQRFAHLRSKLQVATRP
ncbi:putative RNA-directed DNA polymerase [Helianthus annuus]|nr:putative RNA-directed DNA polymerase [Helianthus annuus]